MEREGPISIINLYKALNLISFFVRKGSFMLGMMPTIWAFQVSIDFLLLFSR
jgi:hypothetical protein